MLAIVAALVCTYAAWRIHAERSLLREIARIEAARDPIFPADFDSPPLAAGDNAAKSYESAAGLLNLSKEDGDFLTRSNPNHRVAEDFMSTCGPLVERQRAALAAFRAAGDVSQINWAQAFTSPLMDHAIAKFAPYRDVSKVLRAKSHLDHQQGHDDEVLRNLRDIQALAEAIDQQGMLIPHLVTLSINAQGLYVIEAVAPGLSISDSTDLSTNGAARRSDVQSLIKRLLDQQQLAAGMKRSLQFERALMLDCVIMVTTGRISLNGMSGTGARTAPPFNPLRWLAVPVFNLDGVAMLEYMSHMIRAAEYPSLPQFKLQLRSLPTPPWEGQLSALDKMQHVLSLMLVPSLDRSVLLHYRMLAHRRMAATALAIRLYEIDHGRRPAALAELVPDYLPEVPADSMSSNGVIQYLPGADPPRLYSIGPDGVDDGGAFVFKRRDGIDFDKADSPFFLNGPPPEAPEE